MDIKLYRGKRIDNGEWCFGFVVPLNSDHSKLTIVTHWNNEDEYGSVYEIYPHTLCHSSGLKDLNGVEVFEGDFIFFSDEDHFEGNVTDASWFGIIKNMWHRLMIYDEFAETKDDLEDMTVDGVIDGEVIGNKWDNPEIVTTTCTSCGSELKSNACPHCGWE